MFPENNKYGNTKTSQLKNNNNNKFGPQHLFDGVNDDSGYENNWATSSSGKHPWFQVKFTETIFIAGLEIRAFGFEVKKTGFSFQKPFNMHFQNTGGFQSADIRAGMKGTESAGGMSGSLRITSPVRTHYVGPAGQGETVYLSFPHPVRADFLLIQLINVNSATQLSEVKVIKCRIYTHFLGCYISFCSRV